MIALLECFDHLVEEQWRIWGGGGGGGGAMISAETPSENISVASITKLADYSDNRY